MIKDFPYQNLQDYLNTVFEEGSSPTAEAIKAEKANYKRFYNSALKKEIRQVKKHLTISLEKAEHRRLVQFAQRQGVSLYQYIRAASLNPSPVHLQSQTLQQLKIQVLELIEELAEQIEDASPNLNQIQTQVENIHQSIQEILSSYDH